MLKVNRNNEIKADPNDALARIVAPLVQGQIRSFLNDHGHQLRAQLDRDTIIQSLSKRIIDGVRLQVYALADDVLRLLAAIEADDPFAYKVAATEAREHAGNACFHAALWVNKTREGERPATEPVAREDGDASKS